MPKVTNWKKNTHQRCIQKNWTRKSFFQKKPHQKDQQNHSEKKKMGNFSTRIMKNAAETKSISQNSNKIIQKNQIKLFSVCTFKKSLTTTAKLCFLILCKSCSMNFSCLFLHHFMISKKYCEKKMGSKNFPPKRCMLLHCEEVCFFSIIT